MSSMYTAPFERTCGYCGAIWHGREILTIWGKRLGDWSLTQKGSSNFNIEDFYRKLTNKDKNSNNE